MSGAAYNLATLDPQAQYNYAKAHCVLPPYFSRRSSHRPLGSTNNVGLQVMPQRFQSALPTIMSFSSPLEWALSFA